MRSSINRPPTPDAEEDQGKEPTLQEIINIKLIESGEKERLKELLRERLIECGWRDEMKALCRAFTRKKGRHNVTVDDLVHVITPKGRAYTSFSCLSFSLNGDDASTLQLGLAVSPRRVSKIQKGIIRVSVDMACC
ncbi:PREDICTED: transcription and mRNA export factor SUS1-like isoform X1 [Nelumbo nucifera]|nr:PREDICTED: transcription and mRNA export factor SUS1-like isoform X1 [Nelumbo nucifera]